MGVERCGSSDERASPPLHDCAHIRAEKGSDFRESLHYSVDALSLVSSFLSQRVTCLMRIVAVTQSLTSDWTPTDRPARGRTDPY